MYFANGEGHAGELCWFWNGQKLNINVIASSSRFIHCLIKDLVSNTSFFSTFVYAFPQKNLQAQIWYDLIALNTNNQPWVLIGDFNIILNMNEKVGEERNPNIHMLTLQIF